MHFSLVGAKNTWLIRQDHAAKYCCCFSVIRGLENRLAYFLLLFDLLLFSDFLLYAFAAAGGALYLMFKVAPKYGKTHIFVNIGICSLFGSLSVISCKALGMAVKMTFEGNNQFIYPATYFCILVSLKTQ